MTAYRDTRPGEEAATALSRDELVEFEAACEHADREHGTFLSACPGVCWRAAEAIVDAAIADGTLAPVEDA